MFVRLLFPCFAALGLAGIALPVNAATRVEVQVARSSMDSYGSNTAFIEAVFSPRPLGHTRYSWSPDGSLGWINGRHLALYDDSRYSARPSVALAAVGARVHRGDVGDWYQPLFFSFQVAATNHVTHALSSHYQFVSTLGWQARHFSLALRHISDGNLRGPNRGETMIVAGLAFDF